jgi:hypothetical protein
LLVFEQSGAGLFIVATDEFYFYFAVASLEGSCYGFGSFVLFVWIFL